MRFNIIIQVEQKNEGKNVYPYNYQSDLAETIYQIIDRPDTDFNYWLEHINFFETNKSFRLVNYSKITFPKQQYADDDILKLQENEVCVPVSFYPSIMIERYVPNLFVNQRFELKNKGLFLTGIVTRVELVPEPEFMEEMEYTTISPLLISYSENHTQASYLPPDHPQFEDIFINNLIEKYIFWSNFNKTPLMTAWENEIRIEPADKVSNKVIKIKENKKEIVNTRGFWFDFKLTAPVELQKIGYYAGFGEKNALGFGFCDCK